MKQFTLFFLLLTGLFFTGCVEDPTTGQPNIEESADKAKNFIDKIGGAAKKILEGDDLDKVKGLIDSVAHKSKNIEKIVKENKGKWKEKLDGIKNDPEIKKILEDFKGDQNGLLKQLEDVVKDISETAEGAEGSAEGVEDTAPNPSTPK